MADKTIIITDHADGSYTLTLQDHDGQHVVLDRVPMSEIIWALEQADTRAYPDRQNTWMDDLLEPIGDVEPIDTDLHPLISLSVDKDGHLVIRDTVTDEIIRDQVSIAEGVAALKKGLEQ